MANAVGSKINGRVVLIKKDVLVEEYRSKEDRAYYIVGGYGADPDKMGEALFGFFVKDGLKAKMKGRHVDEVVADSLEEYEGPVSRDLVDKLNLLSQTHD